MNIFSEPNPSDAERKAAKRLARLHEQTEQAQNELTLLQRDVKLAESRLGRSRASQLVEANEHLVLSALASQSEAASAARALQDVSRFNELDALTELPNRVLLLDRFAQAKAHAKRRNVRMAMLFLDLDHFKDINDTLGHAFGDQVLKLAATRLRMAVRQVDTVSRHGGDEFLVMVNEVSQSSDAIVIADKILAALAAPCRVGDHVLRLTASVGISIFPDDGDTAEELIDRADTAMYRAKKIGPGRAELFVMKAQASSAEKATLPSLRRPLTRYEAALAEQEDRHQQLREANERLVLAVLTAQDLQAAAERAHRRQTESLAFVAHEFRNPLAPLRTTASLLSRVDANELPGLQAVIERQVVHMTRLVEDLLDVSRANTGKFRLEIRAITLSEVIDQSIDACRPAMDLRLQHFEVDLPSVALGLNGDPVRLVQVLTNLLDNATKYTPDGGKISVTVAVADGQVEIAVSDNGIGITAEVMPDIFEPFVRDGHAVAFAAVGLGIGLTVVRELVEAHGGKIVATSDGAGSGSRFVVTLPLLTELQGAEPAQLGIAE